MLVGEIFVLSTRYRELYGLPVFIPMFHLDFLSEANVQSKVPILFLVMYGSKIIIVLLLDSAVLSLGAIS